MPMRFRIITCPRRLWISSGDFVPLMFISFSMRARTAFSAASNSGASVSGMLHLYLVAQIVLHCERKVRNNRRQTPASRPMRRDGFAPWSLKLHSPMANRPLPMSEAHSQPRYRPSYEWLAGNIIIGVLYGLSSDIIWYMSKKVAVAVTHHILAKAFDGVLEVEVYSIAAVPTLKPASQRSLAARDAMSRGHRLPESRIAAFQIEVAVLIRYVCRLFFCRHVWPLRPLSSWVPYTSVVTQRLTHESQFRLVFTVYRYRWGGSV